MTQPATEPTAPPAPAPAPAPPTLAELSADVETAEAAHKNALVNEADARASLHHAVGALVAAAAAKDPA